MACQGDKNVGGPEIIALRSAGGVVVRPRKRGFQVAVMFSRFHTWVFPKGGIMPGETPEQAARREVQEEVGLTDLRLIASLGTTEHQYQDRGRSCRKRVDWFLFTPSTDAEPTPAPHHGALDAGWFPARRALSLLTHPNQRSLLRRALKHLSPAQFEQPAAPETNESTP